VGVIARPALTITVLDTAAVMSPVKQPVSTQVLTARSLRRRQMILMSTVTIAVIVAAVIVAVVLVIGVTAVRRRRRLQQRFGPEYDRLASEHDSKRKAESELAGRERRVHGLDIQPLTDSARASYALQWAAIQEQFVDAPEDAVASSQVLVVAVMSELGYPAEDPDQVLADLSVEHAATLDHYRAAEGPSRSAAAGTASTEDLRLAMIDYRALFRDLVGESAGTGNGSSAAETALATESADMQAADTQPELAVIDPVPAWRGQQFNQTSEEELTK
jgi:hypothetical protein